MNPIISIIVPVYNAEETLNRCVDSILNQSFQDWELLLINDGSTDRTGEICDEYAAIDQRIKVFHKENGGVSSARNIGLDHTKGKWITFVDADDQIIPNALNYFSKANIADDLFFFSFYFSYKDGRTVFETLNVPEKINNISLFLNQNIHRYIFKVVWGKFFNRNLLNGIRFDEKIKVGEDMLFILVYLSKIKTCNIQQTPLYIQNKGDDNDFYSKYQQAVKDSIYALVKNYMAYKALNIKSEAFERYLFFDYKKYAQEAINVTPSLWFKNKSVKKIYGIIKNNLGVRFRIRYYLLSFNITYKIKRLLKK